MAKKDMIKKTAHYGLRLLANMLFIILGTLCMMIIAIAIASRMVSFDKTWITSTYEIKLWFNYTPGIEHDRHIGKRDEKAVGKNSMLIAVYRGNVAITDMCWYYDSKQFDPNEKSWTNEKPEVVRDFKFMGLMYRVEKDLSKWKYYKSLDTYRYRIPLWTLFIITSPYPCIKIIYKMRYIARLKYRRKTGRCIECGYDLTGNESGVCPECGWGLESLEKEDCEVGP